MKINEVETLTGIPKATIRYYESLNLVCPKRSGNGYRSYEDKEIQRLQSILVLRKIGIPLEKIQQYFSGTICLESLLEENIESLDQKYASLDEARILNERMLEMEADFNEEKIWKEILNNEEQGKRYAEVPEETKEFNRRWISHANRLHGFLAKEARLFNSREELAKILESF